MDDYAPSPDPELEPADARRADPSTPEPMPVPRALQALRGTIPPNGMFNDVMLNDVMHEQPASPPSPITEPVKRNIKQQVLITLHNREVERYDGCVVRSADHPSLPSVPTQRALNTSEFKCKSAATKFERFAQAYADKMGADRKSLQFAFGGKRLRFKCNKSLSELELYDGDVVDVMIAKHGWNQ
ncbi:hypothetical protein GGF31_003679 [Allomyces arbusculus]|nr:hypothetical protein GGF31_003679 [Allomyces arbusculus]